MVDIFENMDEIIQEMASEGIKNVFAEAIERKKTSKRKVVLLTGKMSSLEKIRE